MFDNDVNSIQAKMYEDNIVWKNKREAKMEKMRKEQHDNELKDFTFKPTLVSTKPMSSVSDMRSPKVIIRQGEPV